MKWCNDVEDRGCLLHQLDVACFRLLACIMLFLRDSESFRLTDNLPPFVHAPVNSAGCGSAKVASQLIGLVYCVNRSIE